MSKTSKKEENLTYARDISWEEIIEHVKSIFGNRPPVSTGRIVPEPKERLKNDPSLKIKN